MRPSLRPIFTDTLSVAFLFFLCKRQMLTSEFYLPSFRYGGFIRKGHLSQIDIFGRLFIRCSLDPSPRVKESEAGKSMTLHFP